MREQEQRSAVAAEARTWLATPYHHHARLKGIGVDCLQLLCAVYETCGCVPHVDPGWYSREHHLHRSEELYIEGLERWGAREVQTPAMGDIALFKFGRTWSHGGIIVEVDRIRVVHSYLGRGVYENALNEEPLDGRAPRFWSLWA
jgi:cell wall-associated NlpC family hydrolase